MKISKFILLLGLSISLSSLATDDLQVECSYDSIPATVNRFSANLIFKQKDDGKVTTTLTAQTLVGGDSKTLASDPIKLEGAIVAYSAGSLTTQEITALELVSADKQVHLRILLGVPGPYSAYDSQAGIHYKSSCH